MVGNVYLGKVQNVLPSMEAAFVDIGRGRNAVLYAGEVNWDATGLEGRARSIEQALKSGDSVLVQVTKDPIGHKGARLTSHVALSGRHLVYVPNGHASGISRKLSDVERRRLRDILKNLVPDGAGVIVRTAAEGAAEDDLATRRQAAAGAVGGDPDQVGRGQRPAALSAEPDLVIRVVRDLFNEDFREVVIQGTDVYDAGRAVPRPVCRRTWSSGCAATPATGDVFAEWRIDEQILKGLDRKVYLPSGGHLVIDRTEAMTVVDVNTGKYTGAGGNLEETVTRNNLEAAEEIVRQLRLRDLGGIVVIDFIDMVLESNRDLVLRRLTECLGRDRTKHQVTEITSLGLVQMTRKRIGQGLLEAFSETCDHCKGRGVIIQTEPVPEKRVATASVRREGTGDGGLGHGRIDRRRDERGPAGAEAWPRDGASVRRPDNGASARWASATTGSHAAELADARVAAPPRVDGRQLARPVHNVASRRRARQSACVLERTPRSRWLAGELQGIDHGGLAAYGGRGAARAPRRPARGRTWPSARQLRSPVVGPPSGRPCVRRPRRRSTRRTTPAGATSPRGHAPGADRQRPAAARAGGRADRRRPPLRPRPRTRSARVRPTQDDRRMDVAVAARRSISRRRSQARA